MIWRHICLSSRKNASNTKPMCVLLKANARTNPTPCSEWVSSSFIKLILTRSQELAPCHRHHLRRRSEETQRVKASNERVAVEGWKKRLTLQNLTEVSLPVCRMLFPFSWVSVACAQTVNSCRLRQPIFGNLSAFVSLPEVCGHHVCTAWHRKGPNLRFGPKQVFNKRVLKWRSETHTVALKGKPWKATASKRSFSCKRKHVPKQEGYHPNTTQSSLQFYWWHAMGHKGVRLKGPVMHRCGSAQINVTNVYGPETPLTSALIGKYHIWGSWWLVQSRGHSGKCAKIGRPPSSTAEREIDQST